MAPLKVISADKYLYDLCLGRRLMLNYGCLINFIRSNIMQSKIIQQTLAHYLWSHFIAN